MTELQKELNKKIIIFFLSVFGILIFFYLCTVSELFGIIALTFSLSAVVMALVGGILYAIISDLIKDYKIRGVLTRDEYERYPLYGNHW